MALTWFTVANGKGHRTTALQVQKEDKKMCQYCNKSELDKMRNEVDAILSEDYSDDTEDRLNDTLEAHAIFTIWGWEGGMFYFLDGTYWDEDHFTKWNNSNFTYCPVCGAKIEG